MKTIFAESVEGRRAPGLALPVDDDAPRAAQMLPEALLRKSEPRLPQCSELDVVRHFTNLSKLNYSVDANFLSPWLLHHEVQPQVHGIRGRLAGLCPHASHAGPSFPANWPRAPCNACMMPNSGCARSRA